MESLSTQMFRKLLENTHIGGHVNVMTEDTQTPDDQTDAPAEEGDAASSEETNVEDEVNDPQTDGEEG